jgi:hypothetical protein
MKSFFGACIVLVRISLIRLESEFRGIQRVLIGVSRNSLLIRYVRMFNFGEMDAPDTRKRSVEGRLEGPPGGGRKGVEERFLRPPGGWSHLVPWRTKERTNQHLRLNALKSSRP